MGASGLGSVELDAPSLAAPAHAAEVDSDEAAQVELVAVPGLVAGVELAAAQGLLADVDPEPSAVALPERTSRVDSDGATPDASEAVLSPAIVPDMDVQPDPMEAIASPALGAEVDAKPDAIASPAVDSDGSATTVLPPALGLDS